MREYSESQFVTFRRADTMLPEAVLAAWQILQFNKRRGLGEALRSAEGNHRILAAVNSTAGEPATRYEL